MSELSDAYPWVKYLILLIAVGVGYVIISKLLDAMMPSKSRPLPPPDHEELTTMSLPNAETDLQDVDALRKRQDEEYKSWEKDRRK